MENHAVTFMSDGLKLLGYFRIPEGNNPHPAVLFLHGAGKSSHIRFEAWQQYLATVGIASLSFDFRGCGESEGRFEDGTLDARLADATAAYRYLTNRASVDPSRICIGGSSMGGHIACMMTEQSPKPKALILLSAAAYGTGAENLKLNTEFTTFLRKESYMESQAFKSLDTYQGPVLVIYGDNDTVIPIPIQEFYRKRAITNGMYYKVKDATHAILNPETLSKQQRMKEVFSFSEKFLNKYL